MKKPDSRSKSLDLKRFLLKNKFTKIFRLNDTQFGRQINEKFLHQNQMTSKTKGFFSFFLVYFKYLGLPLDKNKPNLFLKSFYSSIRPIYETKRMK